MSCRSSQCEPRILANTCKGIFSRRNPSLAIGNRYLILYNLLHDITPKWDSEEPKRKSILFPDWVSYYIRDWLGIILASSMLKYSIRSRIAGVIPVRTWRQQWCTRRWFHPQSRVRVERAWGDSGARGAGLEWALLWQPVQKKPKEKNVWPWPHKETRVWRLGSGESRYYLFKLRWTQTSWDRR